MSIFRKKIDIVETCVGAAERMSLVKSEKCSECMSLAKPEKCSERMNLAKLEKCSERMNTVKSGRTLAPRTLATRVLALRMLALRTLALVAAVVCAVTLLAGCGEIRLAENMAEDVLLSINNDDCMLAEGVFRLMEIKDRYDNGEELFWDRAVGEMTMDSYVKESVLEEMKKITSSVLMAEEMGLYLTSEEQTKVKSDAAEAYKTVGATHDLGAYNITQQDVVELYTKLAMYEKVFAKVSENVAMEISEADTKIIKVNYVELPASMSLNDIEVLRAEIKSGTSFERAVKVMGFEPQLNVQIMKGDMPKAFEDMAYALTDGELSEAVSGTDCIYLIQCVEDYMISESVANNNKVLSQARTDAFNEKYDDLAKRVLLRINQEKWDEVDIREV